MIKIYVNDVINYCDAKLLIGNKDVEIKDCFIDSKKVTRGSTFIGIKGENTDGSLFYKEAFDNGADVCIINKINDIDLKGYDDKTVIIANDTRKVLHQLASYKRSLFNGKVIGITGSVGKTTTKEMLSSVLSEKYKILKTIGNENSQIGLPLNILRLKDEDILVLEMGMSNLGEIHNLSLIAKPDIAVITNVLDSHIEHLKTKENILKAKLEILDGMINGILLINNDNELLNKWNNENKKENIITVGIQNNSDITACNIAEGINTYFDIENINNLKVLGSKELITNTLLVYKVAKIFDVPDELIKEGVNNFSNVPHRLEVIHLKNNITLIDDSYNASFESVKSSLNLVSKIPTRKIAVLADILELGKESKIIHKKIGYEVIKNKVDILITIGKYSKHIRNIARKYNIKTKHFKEEEKSRRYVKKLLKKEDVILVKGSNGMKLINLVNYLKEG